jgi:hypothetical protein
MALEDRIRTSVDGALSQLSARLDQDLRRVVDEMVAIAQAERDHAVNEALQVAAAEAQADTRRQVEDAEVRVRASMDSVITQAREEERKKTAVEVRMLVEAEAEQRLSEATAASESRMKIALADAEAQSAQRLNDCVNEARVREREAEMAALTRLLESIRRLDGGTSLTEVLDALGDAAGREVSRAAVLVLRNDRVLGWRLSGFGSRDREPRGIDLSLTESGVIGLAVGTARPVTTRDSQTALEGPGFAHLPADRMGFAVPVIVGGRVVAVVYADSMTTDPGEQAVPSGWPEVIEVLARHAARCLEALAVQKAASASSPRFWVPSATPSAQTGVAPQSTTPSASSTRSSRADDSPPGARA